MNEARGYLPVLRNRNFLKLWIAQILSLVALQSLLLLALILIEQVAQSGLQTAGAIVAFSLPAVIFGPIAGVVLDRISKKSILVVSNALRVASQAVLAFVAYLGLQHSLDPALFAIVVYITIFITSAIGQFFSPAEGSTIPLVVPRHDLLAANSLFTLTIVAMQVVALVLFVPIAVKSIGLIATLVSLGFFYAAATLLLMLLPHDRVERHTLERGEWGVRRGWREIGEGWTFVIRHKLLFVAVLQFALVFTIVSVLGEMAPGYASRVLGMATEDAVFVFSPAGVGLILASLFIVRVGPRLPRFVLPLAGMVLMGVGLLGLGGLGLVGKSAASAVLTLGPLRLSALYFIGIVSPLAGIGLALVLIPAQTAIQEQATDQVRGRVLTVQLTLANALSIPLLIAAGGLADLFGISQIVIGLGVILFPLALLNVWYVRRFPGTPQVPMHTQPMPLPGETPAMLDDSARPGGKTLPPAQARVDARVTVPGADPAHDDGHAAEVRARELPPKR